MSDLWRRIATQDAGEEYAAAYAARFRRLAERGVDVHGEADLVTALVPPPARVLDAGCGTGRIAVRLDELGYEVVGTDVDAPMVEVARAEAPHLPWHVGDLADLDLGRGLVDPPQRRTDPAEPFDLVLLAGNVPPLAGADALPGIGRSLRAHVRDDGLVLAGFGLDAAHLPAGCPPVALNAVDAAFADAGLMVDQRWSGWGREAWDADGGYVVGAWRPVR